MNSNKISIAFAGSTWRSLSLLESLAKHPEFQISWVLTPSAKKVGREKKLTRSPLQIWAEDQDVAVELVEENVKPLPTSFSAPDYLLVVDFGYIIPSWLLELSKIATLNIHPSALPRWRGSSPGQFVLLNGEAASAVSLIKLISKLDAGPIIAQESFTINESWTSDDYYQYSFALARKHLANWLLTHHQQQLPEKPQPENSPTPVAKKIKKADAFLEWNLLKNMMEGFTTTNRLPKSELLKYFFKLEKVGAWPQVVERACRALQPWPVLWTSIPTVKGEKRMQIMRCAAINKKLVLGQVKVEGQQQATWSQVKNVVKV